MRWCDRYRYQVFVRCGRAALRLGPSVKKIHFPNYGVGFALKAQDVIGIDNRGGDLLGGHALTHGLIANNFIRLIFGDAARLHQNALGLGETAYAIEPLLVAFNLFGLLALLGGELPRDDHRG